MPWIRLIKIVTCLLQPIFEPVFKLTLPLLLRSHLFRFYLWSASIAQSTVYLNETNQHQLDFVAKLLVQCQYNYLQPWLGCKATMPLLSPDEQKSAVRQNSVLNWKLLTCRLQRSFAAWNVLRSIFDRAWYKPAKQIFDKKTPSLKLMGNLRNVKMMALHTHHRCLLSISKLIDKGISSVRLAWP